MSLEDEATSGPIFDSNLACDSLIVDTKKNDECDNTIKTNLTKKPDQVDHFDCDCDGEPQDIGLNAKSMFLQNNNKHDTGVFMEVFENASSSKDREHLTESQNNDATLSTHEASDCIVSASHGQYTNDKTAPSKHDDKTELETAAVISKQVLKMDVSADEYVACSSTTVDDDLKHASSSSSLLLQNVTKQDKSHESEKIEFESSSSSQANDIREDPTRSTIGDDESDRGISEADDALYAETGNVPSSRKRRKVLNALLDSDNNSTSSSDDSTASVNSEDVSNTQNSDAKDDDEWLKKDIGEMSLPKWTAVHELRHRQIGQLTDCWTRRICSSRAMVGRFGLEWELKEHQGCVNALHFNRAGTLLASGSDDLKIMLWDWIDKDKPPLVNYDSGHRSNVFQAKFLPDCGDSTVVSSARDGQVRVANISSTGACRTTKKVAQHRGSAHKISLDSEHRSTFLSCGEDGVVFGIDVRLDKPSEKLVAVKVDNRKIPLYSIHSNPTRPYEFAVSGREPRARIYDRRMLAPASTVPVKVYCPHHLESVSDLKANITCLVYNWDGSELLCSYNDEDIYLFDTSHSTGADYVKRYKGHRNNATVKGVNFYGPRSEFVVSGSDCGNIFFWDRDSAQVVQYVEGDRGGVVNCIEPHPNLPMLATSGLDSEVKIWTPQRSASETMDQAKLKRLMLSNRRERDEDRESMPDSFQNHLLWFLMRTLRNRARRQDDDDGDASDSSSEASASSVDSASSSYESYEGGENGPMRCTQS